MPLTVDYAIAIADTRAHLVDVVQTIRADAPLGALTLFMPVWTPGSYLVREFARHVEGLTCEPASVSATKVRKNAWRIACGAERAVRVRYRLYANDLSVRTNHVDDTHAFLNGAATFLAVEGHEARPVTVAIDAPAGWSVATPLARTGPLTFEAPSFDALVDSPIEIGTHLEQPFEALGVRHSLAAWPRDAVDPRDLERMASDAAAIVTSAAELFDGALPYSSYLCILHLSSRGRGGLEHASSATLLSSAASFAQRDSYLELLSLFAHEIFHAWNVKRIRPAALTPYRYQEESYTRLLWWFEGATSYYDWRILRRAALCTVGEYLDHLAGEIAYVEATPGRLVHALEEASFDAWIKMYRPDENTPNSSVSYYRKGELVSAMLDLEIRARSGGRASLDTVLASLWRDHGARGVPVPEGAMQEIVERATGVAVGDLFDTWIRAPGEVDCGSTLKHVGLAIERQARSDRTRGSLGVRLSREGGRVVVSHVVRGGASQRAGIDAGDELVAIDGRRAEGTSLDTLLQGRRTGDKVQAMIARDGTILAHAVTLDEPRADKVKLVVDAEASGEARARFVSWMGEPHPEWSAS